MDYKLLVGGIAVVMNIIAFLPYIIDTARGKCKPHIFSWLIWTLITGVVFISQVAEHAGPGAWVTGVTTLINLIILVLSLKQGSAKVTLIDKLCLAFALPAVALCYFTEELLISISLVIIADILAFIPTIRKSLTRPHEETFITYPISVVRCMLGLFAITNFTFTTAAYPAVMLALYIFMTLLLLPSQPFYARRRKPEIIVDTKESEF
ncbi:MAG TPA: hypothetical protein VD907_06130 [Verrucomicrobiae bacterium]|nr:hypothetical protein [Verrucomicrobiae bacterium]